MFHFDRPPLMLSALGATAAAASATAWSGFHPAPAPALAAAFLGAWLPFLIGELRQFGWCSPVVLFLLGLAYYHVLVPVEYLVDPQLPRSLMHELPSLKESDFVRPLIAADLALATFLLGAALRWSPSRDVLPPRYELDEQHLTRFSLLLIALGVVLYLAMSVVATGSVSGIFNTTYQERDELFYGLGALGFGINLVYVGATTLGVLWLTRSGSLYSLLSLLLCAAMGLHSFLVGSKMHVFHVGIGTLAGCRTSDRRIPIPIVLGLILVLAVPLLFVGLARNKQGQGLQEMATFVEEQADGDSINPANIDAWGPYLTLVHTTSTLRIPEDLHWGSTYLQILTLLPPRFLYPSRPRPTDEQFAQDFLGQEYYDNAGFGYSGITEAYVNGGLPGVGLVFLLFGLGCGALRERLLRWRGSLAAAILLGTAAPWLALALREQAAAVAKGYGLMTLAPTWALLWLSHRRVAAA